MVPPLVKTVFYKNALPIVLITAGILRPSAVSAVYIFFGLLCALLPKIPSQSYHIPGSVRTTLFAVTTFSGIALIGQIIFQIVVNQKVNPDWNPDAKYAASCKHDALTIALRVIGFERFSATAVHESSDALRLIFPEILAGVGSMVVCIVTFALKHWSTPTDTATTPGVQPVRSSPSHSITSIATPLFATPLGDTLRRTSNMLIIILIGVVGCIQPSLLSLPYFITFLCVLTWYTSKRSIQHSPFNKFKLFTIFYSALHFMIIFVYQIPIIRDLPVFEPRNVTANRTTVLEEKALVSRLLGLSPIMEFNCSKWYNIQWDRLDDDGWPVFVNPFAILILFQVMIWQHSFTKQGTHRYTPLPNERDNGSSVHEELLGEEDCEEPGTQVTTHMSLKKFTSEVMDRQRIMQIIQGSRARGNANENAKDMASRGLAALVHFFFSQAYILGLIAMMVWAMLYHSVFGLILLLVACAVWIFPDSKRAAFSLSPGIIAYVEFLLIVQYTCSMDLREEMIDSHLVTTVNTWLPALGLKFSENRTEACLILLAKLLLSLPIFLILRLARRAREFDALTEQEKMRRINNYGTFNPDSTMGAHLQAEARNVERESAGSERDKDKNKKGIIAICSESLVKLWLPIICLTLVFASVWDKENLFHTGYLVFFAVLICTFKTSFSLFRHVYFAVLTALTVYTSFVVISTYVYQFPKVPEFFKNITHLPEENYKAWTEDIGLIDFKKSGDKSLAFHIFPSIILYVVTILQLKMFHRKWMNLTDPHRDEQEDAPPSTSRTRASSKNRFSARMGVLIAGTIDLFWKIMEVHVTRIVLFIIVAVIANQANPGVNHVTDKVNQAVFIPVYILISIAVCLPKKGADLISLLICVYLCVLALAKMVFQISIFPTDGLLPFGYNNSSKPNCSRDNVDFVNWLGFYKTGYSFELLKDIVVAILLLALQSLVFYRRIYIRAVNRESCQPAARILVFPDFNPKEFDSNLESLFKWLVDYVFYKFGVEITTLILAINVWVRMDGVAVINAVFLVLIVLSPRSVIRAFWPLLLVYMAIIFPLQFVLHVGLPPAQCIPYPWDGWISAFPVLLNLPRAHYTWWNGGYFVMDYLALVAIACQLYVFREERDDHPAGDNKSIYLKDYIIFPKSEHYYDFVTEQKSFVDYFKIVIFQYGHWVSLLFVLIAGLGGTSLFALGYIILSLQMLWKGNNLYLMKGHRQTLTKWRTVLLYTSTVIVIKVALQVVGCTNIDGGDPTKNEGESTSKKFDDWRCIWRSLFAIKCVCNNVLSNALAANFDTTCSVEMAEAAIGYDAFALVFAFFQMRVLNSYYFQYCATEFRSELVLANRGAVLSNQLVEKEMKEQEEQQQKKFADIKERTKAIKQRYEELQKRDQDRDGPGMVEPDTYGASKRAGDYYMFDYDPAKDELKMDKTTFVPEVDPGASDFNKLDPTQLVYAAAAHDLNLKETLEKAETAEDLNEQKALTGKRDGKTMMLEAVRKQDKPEAGPSAENVENEESIESDNEGLLVTFGRFAFKILKNTLDMISAFLNRHSREHRYVSYVLSKERQLYKALHGNALEDVTRPISQLCADARNNERLILVKSESDIPKFEGQAMDNWQKRNVLARLINAFGHCVAAHTDIVCYLLAIACHARGAGLITLALPIMVFLWGSLSNPRPSKFFWVAMILYTEAIIVIKFIFQFGFLSWNKGGGDIIDMENSKSWVNIIGLQRKPFYCGWEVALLMALFFHRYMLRKLGLWKDANVLETFDSASVAPSVRSVAGAETGIENPALETSTEGSHGSQNGSRRGSNEDEQPLRPHQEPPSTRTARSPPYDEPREERQMRRRTRSEEERPEVMEEERTQSPGDSPAEMTAIDDRVEKKAEDVVDGGEADKERSGMGRFIYQLFYPKFHYISDLYPAMFGLDVIFFLVITFGYSSFGEGGSGNVVSDIQSNRVPLAFVVMLIVCSFMIVIDRGLYLRKASRCKLIYQLLIIGFMHGWIFFALPFLTNVPGFKNNTAQFLYFVKSVYLLISAWQIRNGYPDLCVGNFLMHSYGMFNMICYKIFMLAPFVFELRTAIDWTWTDTSMPLFDFFNMEQFYSTIYNLKCARVFEQKYPAPRGEPKGVVVKYLMGLPFVIFIILLIWLPLLAFSLLNKVGANLIPVHASMTVSIDGYPPLFQIEAQGREIKELKEPEELSNLAGRYAQLEDWNKDHDYSLARSNYAEDLAVLRDRVRRASAFLNDYKKESILRVQFRPESQTRWLISDASLIALKKDLQLMSENKSGYASINIALEFTRDRESDKKEPKKHTGSFTVPMNDDLVQRLIKAIDGDPDANVRLNHAIPKFVIMPNEGQILSARPLIDASVNATTVLDTKGESAYSSLNLRYQSANNNSIWTGQFRFEPKDAMEYLQPVPGNIPYTSPFHNLTTYVELITFVDRVFPSMFSSFVSGGIIAMYIALVLMVGRLIRGILTSTPMNVMITEIPNPDHLLKICLDIYLVREARDFFLEQDLYAKLIFLFRSPATLIKWTRHTPKPKTD